MKIRLGMAVGILAGCLAGHVRGADIVVSPAGPVRTLAAARDAARQASKPARIVIQAGTYELAEPLVLGPEDSGVTWEAAPDARPVVSGGTKLAPFSDHDGLWQTPGSGPIEQLWIGGKRAVPARFPNSGFLRPLKVDEEKIDDETSRQTISVQPADIAALKDISPEEVRQMQILVSHKWDNTRRPVTLLDVASGRIVTEGKPMKGNTRWDATSVFVLEQQRGLLDEPGEWANGPGGAVLYKPASGQTPSIEAVAPRLSQLVILRGEAGQKVHDIRFKGIAFRYAGWVSPPQGFEPQQAAAGIEAVIQADHTRDIAFDDCEIAHTGLYGVWFRKGCTGTRIEHCNIHDTGAGGVRFGTMDSPVSPEDLTGGNTLDNSIVSDGGHVFPCAVGVWIGQSGDNTVTHNEIGWQSYSGVSVGWRWGYAESPAKRNIIDFNHIHHIGDGLLSDMGAVYTLGPSEGTVIRNNHIHDVTALTYGGWGLYNDEGSTGIVMENNLVTGTKSGSYHQHYGKENILRNNILAFAKSGQLQLTRAEPHLSFHLTGNIVLWQDGPLLANAGWAKGNYEIDRNVYWRLDGKAPDFTGMPLDAWQAKGHDVNSLIADPLFRDPGKGDWTLAPDSPALKLGFAPFDPALAGLQGDAAWVAMGKATPNFKVRYPQ